MRDLAGWLGALALAGCAPDPPSADPRRAPPQLERVEQVAERVEQVAERVEQVGKRLATDAPGVVGPWSEARDAVEAASQAEDPRQRELLLDHARADLARAIQHGHLRGQRRDR